jgi:hypothetical protein
VSIVSSWRDFDRLLHRRAEGNYTVSNLTILSSYETTVFNGRFPITTYTTTEPTKVDDVISGIPTTTRIFTATAVSMILDIITRPPVSLQSPSCVLPSHMSQCQQSWDSYMAGRQGRRDIHARQDMPTGCDPYATTEIPWSCQAALSSWDAAEQFSYAAEEHPKCLQAKIAEDYCSSTVSEFL